MVGGAPVLEMRLDGLHGREMKGDAVRSLIGKIIPGKTPVRHGPNGAKTVLVAFQTDDTKAVGHARDFADQQLTHARMRASSCGPAYEPSEAFRSPGGELPRCAPGRGDVRAKDRPQACGDTSPATLRNKAGPRPL